VGELEQLNPDQSLYTTFDQPHNLSGKVKPYPSQPGGRYYRRRCYRGLFA